MAQVTSIVSSSDIQADFMQLLTTQLRNQDPLEPMDNYQMASQLTLFSQLQQLESVNSSFTKMLQAAQQSYASSLLGKQVTFADSSDTSQLGYGTVSQIQIGNDGQPLLVVGNDLISLDAVRSVQDTSTEALSVLSSK